MPHTRPFTWLVAVGMLCSLAGLAFTRMPVAASAGEQAPVFPESTAAAGSYGPSNANPTLVTQASPEATEAAPSETPAAASTEQLTFAATPTPQALTAAPSSTVQGIPATLQTLSDVTHDPDKARGLLDDMNDARVKEGLAPLDWDVSLEEVAYARAKNLVQNGYFDHYAPDGESAFSELAARGIRYRLAGENLARNNYLETKTVQAAFDGLMNSPGHRANILEPRFSSVGVAVVRDGKMWVYVTVFLN
jgi:uncharacterized protein YkwD